jgi:uncharacterized protein YodC (DUF2158 family)
MKKLFEIFLRLAFVVAFFAFCFDATLGSIIALLAVTSVLTVYVKYFRKAEPENPNQLKVGDLVQLKSGGPVMVVSAVELGCEVIAWCKWFDKQKPETHSFHSEMLDLISGR